MVQKRMSLADIGKRLAELDQELDFLKELFTKGGEYEPHVPSGMKPEFTRMYEARTQEYRGLSDSRKRYLEGEHVPVEW